MNANDIIDIIGETEDRYIHDAHESRGSRRKRRLVNIALSAAACIILAPMVLFGGFTLFFGGMGAGAPAPGDGAMGDDPTSTEFMSYAGPVLPLSILEQDITVTAERSLNISFANYGSNSPYTAAAGIQDSYVLTNTGSQDISFTALYPYAASYDEVFEEGLVPDLYIDDELVFFNSSPVLGPYSGSFVPVTGAEDAPEMSSANLSGPSSFSDYVNLLSDGSYLSLGFTKHAELFQPVTLYRFSDYEFSVDSSAPNPTLNFSFDMDPARSQILTWNFNGGSDFHDEGRYERQMGGIEYRPNASPENRSPSTAYLIVLGDDISNYTLQGYTNGSCQNGEELDDLGCTVTRMEGSLGSVLWDILEEKYPGEVQELYPIVAHEMLSFGPVAERPATRYNFGMLDSFVYDIIAQNRIAYFAFPLTIPAGESRSIELHISKDASFNHYGSEGDTRLNGYEFATFLGSGLVFSGQRASVSDFEGIEIVSQNFGFDLDAGVTAVELDMNTDNYWMNICKKNVED